MRLLQVQVIDSNGQETPVLVYQCGPDMFWGKTMDAIFTIERRRVAPDWLREQLLALPPERQFRADGTSLALAAQVPVDADAFDIPQG